jgi:nuclear transport factor 2 (NTF2) superfamily protein
MKESKIAASPAHAANSPAVHLEKLDQGAIAVLTLDDPRRANAMSREMGDAFTSRVRAIQDDPTLRVVIIRGAGEHFSIGGHRDMLISLGSGKLDEAELHDFMLGCRITTADPKTRRALHRALEDRPMDAARPPLPPFTAETARQKVRLAEDAWNTRDPDRVVQVYTEDTRWRNRAEFPVGRAEAHAFLRRKWARELDYRLIKELWAFDGARIAVRFAYECHDDSGQWYRSYGNENWEFTEQGLMRRRLASINDLPIRADQRLFHWPLGRRPDDHPGLTELGL